MAMRQFALDVLQRGQHVAARGRDFAGAGQTVEDFGIELVQFVRAAGCQFKSRDESHGVLRCFEGPDHRSLWRPDTQSSPAHGSRWVGRSIETRKDSRDRTRCRMAAPRSRTVGSDGQEILTGWPSTKLTDAKSRKARRSHRVDGGGHAARQHIYLNLIGYFSGGFCRLMAM